MSKGTKQIRSGRVIGLHTILKERRGLFQDALDTAQKLDVPKTIEYFKAKIETLDQVIEDIEKMFSDILK